jgi:hypothetical protein
MKLLDKYIIFTGDKVRESMFAKPPFTCFEVTSYPITFCKNNPSFSIITKIPLLLAL